MVSRTVSVLRLVFQQLQKLPLRYRLATNTPSQKDTCDGRNIVGPWQSHCWLLPALQYVFRLSKNHFGPSTVRPLQLVTSPQNIHTVKMSINGVACTMFMLEGQEADQDYLKRREAARKAKDASLQAFSTGDAKKGAGLFKVSTHRGRKGCEFC